jgi:hypothetical protein
VRRRAIEQLQQLTIPDDSLPEEITSMEMTEGRIKKITTRIIVGKKRDPVTSETLLYKVIGVATGVKTGESNYGPWKALRGEFEAKRWSDGKVFKAPLVVLPEEVIDRIHARLDTGSAAVGFALHVLVQPRAAAPGFVYDYVYPCEPHAHEPLAALRDYL